MTPNANRRRIAPPLVAMCLAAAALAACSDRPAQEDQPQPSPSPVTEPPPFAAPDPPGREFRYTSLDDCPLLRSNPDEGGFYEYDCPGEGGYRLKLVEADLRQNIILVAPGGASRSLDLPALAGGRFSELGETVEWRGRVDGGVFMPDALILRQEVVEDPEGCREVSYLVSVRLGERPCAIARVAPGAGQNERARLAADAPGACLPGPA